MEKKYSDIFETKVGIDELEEGKNKDILAVLEFPFGRSGVMNLNKHYYSDLIWKNAIGKLDKKIQASFVPGTAGHPFGSGTPLKDISHVLTKVWVDSEKLGWAKATLLNTEAGRTTLTVLKSGTKKIGASLRGYGEIDSNGAVKKGLEIKTVDLVIDPSFAADATITPANIIESTILGVEGEHKEHEEHEEVDPGKLSQEEKKLAGILENRQMLKEDRVEKREKNERRFYAEFLEAGGKGSFKDWQEKYGGQE